MTVEEFLEQMSDNATEVVNHPLRFIDFLKHKQSGDKTTREELIPIRAYVRRKPVPLDGEIELGGEAHDFDAKLSYQHEGQSIEGTLEVVQALAEGAHKVRIAIADGRMNDEMRAEEERQRATYPQPIIDAIKAKHGKFYADVRILLVTVVGEVTLEDDGIIESWISEVKKQTELGGFAEIYLVETARYKIFKIH